MEQVNRRRLSTLQKLNFRRVILYIKNTLESIEIGKIYDRTNPEHLLITKVKTMVVDFLNSIKDRKGISDYKILSITVDVDRILLDLDLYINHKDYNAYNIIIIIPYTSNNYGLK